MRHLILFALLAHAPLFAQLHFGLKGGAAFTDLVEPGGNLESRFQRWTLGPMAELDLPLGLAAEFNALYRRTGYATTGGSSNTAGSWEFPLIAKYRFPGAGARPYIGGGLSFRSIGDIPDFTAGSQGFVLSAGIRINAILFKISPEIRYARWNGGTSAPGVIRASQNQVEGLVGLFF